MLQRPRGRIPKTWPGSSKSEYIHDSYSLYSPALFDYAILIFPTRLDDPQCVTYIQEANWEAKIGTRGLDSSDG
jgi:hypothetical protein